MDFKKIHNARINFIKKNKEKDHVVVEGKNSVLLSAPHGVAHVRLGRLKFKEIGSLATALWLKENTDCFLIAKTKNNGDDANFDENSIYKNIVRQLIKTHNIKYLIDIHGLAAKRECDINLGTHLGKNIENNLKAFDELQKRLERNGFRVCIDQPFMAGSKTISGAMKNENKGVWTLQIEINCAITNKVENFVKYGLLLDVLKDWIETLA